MNPTNKDPSNVFTPPATEPDDSDGEQPPHEGEALEFKLDESAQALIGHQLRTLYSEIVREPVPDQLLRLLHDLELKEQQ